MANENEVLQAILTDNPDWKPTVDSLISKGTSTTDVLNAIKRDNPDLAPNIDKYLTPTKQTKESGGITSGLVTGAKDLVSSAVRGVGKFAVDTAKGIYSDIQKERQAPEGYKPLPYHSPFGQLTPEEEANVVYKNAKEAQKKYEQMAETYLKGVGMTAGAEAVPAGIGFLGKGLSMAGKVAAGGTAGTLADVGAYATSPYSATPEERKKPTAEDIANNYAAMAVGEIGIPAVAKTLKGIGWAAKQILGGFTGVGEKAIGSAIESGGKLKGLNIFKSQTDFDNALRGKASAEDVVNPVTSALREVKEQRAKVYTEELSKLKGAKSVHVDMKPIESRYEDLLKRYKITRKPNGDLDFEYSQLDEPAHAEIRRIDAIMKSWRGSNYKPVDWSEFFDIPPSESTREGLSLDSPYWMDTLKQKLDNFYSTQSDSRQFVASLRDSVKQGIEKVYPKYGEMTKGYTDASKFINDIEVAFNLRGKGYTSQVVADQTLRKLMAGLRQNNELRNGLLESLSKYSDKDLMGQTAGYSMRSAIPVGAMGVGGGLGEAYLIHAINPAFWPLMVASSPRALGEFLRLYGKLLKEIPSQQTMKQVSPMVMSSDLKQPVEARAEGGPVMANEPYLVGERGPEVVVPQQNGTVIPNPMTLQGMYQQAKEQGPDLSTQQKTLEYLKKNKVAQEMLSNFGIGSTTGWMKGLPTSKVIKGAYDYMHLPFFEQELTNVGKAARDVFGNALKKIMEKDVHHMNTEQFSKVEEFMKQVLQRYGQLLEADPMMKGIVHDTIESLRASAKSPNVPRKLPVVATAGAIEAGKEATEATDETAQKSGESLNDWNTRLLNMIKSRKSEGEVMTEKYKKLKEQGKNKEIEKLQKEEKRYQEMRM